ncbi:hypothetical protein KK083_09545 [Fulvivirgaceae bacterium PWU4]|uniref:LVIVD repeat-containing protein n=1 Tax=Chryseosolibacter histidini TaxID=2782349 RepID=A0AAP2GML3_9BACT|nr:hypothetical protein [Chryseosolibacter histidini]MBT1697118.1 hypothetical protein [Chryseosolibacter histidini]
MRLLLSILFSGRTLTAATLMLMNIVLRAQTQAPKYVGELSGALLSDPYSVAIAGNYAYVASEGSDALEIIDIANPAAPVHKGSIAHGTGGALLSRPKSVVVSGNYAYVASYGSDALEIVDITNPAAPIHKGSITHGTGGALLNDPYGLTVSGNFVYVVSWAPMPLRSSTSATHRPPPTWEALPMALAERLCFIP